MSENSVNKCIMTTFGVAKLKLPISVAEKKFHMSCSIEHSVLEQIRIKITTCYSFV